MKSGMWPGQVVMPAADFGNEVNMKLWYVRRAGIMDVAKSGNDLNWKCGM
jgi:hypothetical protein